MILSLPRSVDRYTSITFIQKKSQLSIREAET